MSLWLTWRVCLEKLQSCSIDSNLQAAQSKARTPTFTKHSRDARIHRT